MIANNFIDEVKNILEMGYDEKIPALKLSDTKRQ